MSALQHPTTSSRRRRRRRRGSLSFSYCSPSTVVSSSSGEVWRVRENELAKEEIIRRDRKLAFETGRLRGRRLFEEESEVSYDEEEDVHSVCDEINVDHQVVAKKVNEESREVGDANMILIIVVLMVFVLIGFFILGTFDGHVREVNVVVFPT